MTAKQSQGEYERELNEWRCLVGQAILSFGDIDLLTLECLHRIRSDKIDETAPSPQFFSQRIDLLVKIIESRCTAPSPAAEFLDKLKGHEELDKGEKYTCS
jgi:hypothetical protein